MGRTSATVVYESPVHEMRDFFASLSFRVLCISALADAVLTTCSTVLLNSLQSNDASAPSGINISYALTAFFKFFTHAVFVAGLLNHVSSLQNALLLNPECRTPAFKQRAMLMLLLEAFFCVSGAILNFLLLQSSFKKLTLPESKTFVSTHPHALIPPYWFPTLYLKMALVWTTQFLTWFLFQAHFVRPLEQTPDTNLLEDSFLPNVRFSIQEIYDDEDPELAVIFYNATSPHSPCENEHTLTA